MENLFNLKDQDYFRKGIIEIINSKNTGYVPAFGNSVKNGKGVFFHMHDFKEIIESYNILFSIRSLPEKFLVKIKYSPISLFKKWIFTITSEELVEKTKVDLFRKEYFLMKINNEFNFFSISTNVAHENFLYNLYINNEVEEYNLSFQTFFSDKKKIILFKDYNKRKIFSLTIPKQFNIIKNRPYGLKISVIKNLKGARFKLRLNGNKIEHLIRFNKNLEKNNLKLNAHNSKNLDKDILIKEKILNSNSQLTINQFRKEVIELLKKSHNKKNRTNKFANISLGRVNKVMVLVNLSKKYNDQEIKMFFNEKNENFDIFIDEKLVKSFMVSYSPKSNWLEKVKNS